MKGRLAFAAAVLLAAPAGAQERQRGTCEISIGRCAVQTGGSQGAMQVESGRSCGTAVLRRPERNEPTASLSLATPPAHGHIAPPRSGQRRHGGLWRLESRSAQRRQSQEPAGISATP